MLLLAILIISLLSCGEYQTFTIKRGIAHFSFEYPARYGGKQVEVRNDPESKYTSVGLSWGPPERLWRASNIDIFVQGHDSANAEADLERLLSIESNMLDFKLIQRYSVTVSGVEGYGIYYSKTEPPGGGYGPPGVPRPYISRAICFDYGGLIWSIWFQYDEATKDLGEAAYEHVIKTFKILE